MVPAGVPATPFTERLASRAAAAGSAVCVGIDPRPTAHALTHPDGHAGDGAAVARSVVDYYRAVLDHTHDVVACCKPQSAFFEALGLPGLEALAGIMAHARSLDLPVILDAKRGDIGSTAAAYASAYLTDGAFATDALTVNAYLGLDTLEPFIDAAAANGRGLFVLVRTSNPGSASLQELPLDGGGTVFEELARALTARASQLTLDGAGHSLLGAVGGATAPSALAELRALMPHSVLLVPGYGAQGGTADAVAAAFDDRGGGAVVNASRSISHGPGAPEATTFAEVGAAARAAALAMRDDLRGALERA